jgi:hypothetical protein
MIFCFDGRARPVMSGIGKIKITKSVRIFTGAPTKYSVTISMHFSLSEVTSKVLVTGRHRKIDMRVNTRPARLTSTKQATVAIWRNATV